MKKIFIDTSILITACKSKIGGASYILMQCRKGIIQGYVSRYVIYEAKRQIQLNQTEKQRLNFLLLQCKLRIVDEPKSAEVKKYHSLIDVKDAPIVAASKMMRAQYLITLNTRDFMSKKLKEYVKPLEIVTPKNFIKAMNSSVRFDKVIILHGCPPSEEMVTPKEKRWMNWLAEKLQEKGFNAIAPDLPVSWQPKYEDWKKEFEKYPVTENSLLVGHSCGGAFLVRWLLETKKKVKKLILVAPAKVPETENDTRKDLYDFELPSDSSHIADEIVVFASNDFPHHLKSLELYKKALKPRLVTLENKFHFLFFQMKTNEFPELLEEIIEGV